MKIKTYNPSRPSTGAAFWIQSKGKHAGRPLKKPIPNCFEVYTDDPNLFDVCQCLFVGRKYEEYILGSVIPFIRITDLIKVIETKGDFITFNVIKAVNSLSTAIMLKSEEVKLLKEMQKTIIYAAIKKEKSRQKAQKAG